MKTLAQINDLYRETFYLEDEAILPLLIAAVVGSKYSAPPVWFYLVGPSSGGKTELINTFAKIPFVTQISDLTPNTFLSGMANGKQETSLLLQLGMNFVITMKDFTTIMSKSQESQEAIIAQMREIYDGHLVKQTGTGKKIEWGPNGKATFIMASTEAIYAVQEKFADMGTRAINYVLKPQDRILTTKKALAMNGTFREKKEGIQTAIYEFVMDKVRNMPEELPALPEDLQNDIILISDFASVCRSPVKRDYRGEKSLALSAEMPMRMAKQLLSQAQILTYINDGVLSESLKEAIFKMGFDSIQKQRRLVLEVLASYDRVNASAVATKINYNLQRAREWIEDLNMFGVCDRIRLDSREFWKMRPYYRDIMQKYLHILPTGYDLINQDNDGSYESQEAVIVSATQSNVFDL